MFKGGLDNSSQSECWFNDPGNIFFLLNLFLVDLDFLDVLLFEDVLLSFNGVLLSIIFFEVLLELENFMLFEGFEEFLDGGTLGSVLLSDLSLVKNQLNDLNLFFLWE